MVSSCVTESEDLDYVAKVYDQYLTREMLAEQIPATATPDDSIKRAKVFINTWVKEQVVLEKAEFNLNREDDRFKSKVDAYLNDLLIYEYERQLVQQAMDTLVTQEELLSFYEENKSNFILKDFIVKARYLIANEDQKDIEKIARKFRNYSEKDSLDVLSFVESNDDVYFSDNPDEWVFVPRLLETVPINFSYFEDKVKVKSYFDKQDNGRRYLLYVRDFKVRDSESPFELERERIKSIILNTRKRNLLDDMRTGLFQEALEAGQIEIVE
ncbi:MAG: hypothetical protein HKN45_01120 [Flavobacteriales bacterium]|nr:hypothetical protein [Flavobacteriales bacterium]